MSEPIDLKVVPVEDLIQEIANRTENMVIGYTRVVDNGMPIIYINSRGSSYLTALGLLAELHEYIIYKTRPKKEDIVDGAQ